MKIGIIANSRKAGAADTIHALVAGLKEVGFEYALENDTAEIIGLKGLTGRELAASCDIITVIGGDGTMLNAADRLGPTDTPVAGINIGTLGFLTSCTDEEICLLIRSIIDKTYTVIPRIQLEATVRHPNGVEETHHALNEVTLNRGVSGRLVEIEALVNGDLLNYYRADGLIVATPTGSTAYSLAAGGPLISPSADVFVITPICPHSLTNRSVILSQCAVVELKCADEDDAPNIFTVDGRVIIEVAKGGSVIIKKSPNVLNLIHLENRSFYSTLRTKLQWK